MRSHRIPRLLFLLALFPLTSNCTYRESSNGDSYVSKIIFADHSGLRPGDKAINGNWIDVNLNPDIPNP